MESQMTTLNCELYLYLLLTQALSFNLSWAVDGDRANTHHFWWLRTHITGLLWLADLYLQCCHLKLKCGKVMMAEEPLGLSEEFERQAEK